MWKKRSQDLHIPPKFRWKNVGARLEKFLDERPMIRRKEYTQLTGLLKNKALNELNGWVKEGVLDTIGSGSHKIYVRANTKKE